MDKAEITGRVRLNSKPIKEQIIEVAREFSEQTQPNAAKDDEFRFTLRVLFSILPAAGWWNCQKHGQTPEQCKCGAATAYVRN